MLNLIVGLNTAYLVYHFTFWKLEKRARVHRSDAFDRATVQYLPDGGKAPQVDAVGASKVGV